MNSRDWGFAIGNLGDPLADILWWMTPPRPKWVNEKEEVHEQEDECHPDLVKE